MERNEATGESGTTRRGFLKRSVETVGATAVAGVFSAFERASANETATKSAKSVKSTAGATKAQAAKRVFPARFDLKLTKRRTRSTDSYTQGLVFEIDAETGLEILYESGGRYGKSTLRKIDLETGEILREYRFSQRYFAEGIAVVDDRILALTWRERACFVFDKKTFEKLDEFRYYGEGWGLAFDDASGTLAMSDGSSRIRVLDAKTFRQKRTFDVFYLDANGRKCKVANLNELEFVGGELWTNVYQTNNVLRVDPTTGRVLQAIDFSKIVPESLRSSYEYVLNGIAFDGAKNRLFLTGKCWPTLFEFSATPGETAAKTV